MKNKQAIFLMRLGKPWELESLNTQESITEPKKLPLLTY